MPVPLVSAIITTHNRISLLPRAIESVLVQTYRNIECIVVSDNSSDGTKEYCESRKDIKYIDIPASESKGGNYARNLGIKAAKGEYIAFLDDDDYWLSEKIEKQMNGINESRCGCVYCGRSFESVDGQGLTTITEGRNDSLMTGDLSKRVLLTCCITTSSAILVNKELLLNVGLFDENLRFWQDYELTIRLAQQTNFACVPENLVVYRVNPYDANRLTNKYYEWWDAVKYIHKKHKKLYSCLSFKEMRLSKVVVYKDALFRARTCGLAHECSRLEWLVKFWNFPEILSNKVAARFHG